MASAGMVVTVIVVLIALAWVVTTVHSRRWRGREQAYADHLRRRIQAREQGEYPVGGSRPGIAVSTPASPATAGGSLDARTSQLLSELCAIGLSRDFLTTQGERDPRTREIGAELDRMGGMRKMLDVHSMVRAEIGQLHARHLEVAWDRIGSWLG
ncbi:hypothetical protein OG381_47105 [Streptomyces sp. NBC_00490]|uniref:hypothetical protein n=1 Tax=Streptomyces sp. NBC_00490 TaxID=2903657 RepID=UPI002E17BD57